MSTILVNTLTGTTTAGSIAVTGEGNSTTTNLQQGLAKVACRIDQTDSDGTFKHSFNSSSITDGGTGKHTITFTNPMSDALYGASGCKSSTRYNFSVGIATASTFILYNRNDSATYADSSQINGYAYGDLA